MCVSVPGDFLRPQGAFPPGFYPLSWGVHCPAPAAPLTRGMPTGPRAFLANSGRVWATALRPVPPKKRPCAIHARKVGCASNTAARLSLAPSSVIQRGLSSTPHTEAVRPLSKFVQDFIVHMLHGKFFILEFNLVCYNIVTPQDRQRHFMFLYHRRVMIRTP